MMFTIPEVFVDYPNPISVTYEQTVICLQFANILNVDDCFICYKCSMSCFVPGTSCCYKLQPPLGSTHRSHIKQSNENTR